MSRPVVLACAVLLLAASASAFKTASEINLPYGLKAQCNRTSNNPEPGVNPNVLSVANCQTCVGIVANQLVDNRTHGCWDVCQRSSDPSTGEPIIDMAAKAPACQLCIQDEATTVEGCKACLQLPAADFQACINIIKGPAPAGLPWYRNVEYEEAVAKCFTLLDGPANGNVRSKCLTCISTAYARPQSQGGFMTPEETPGSPANRPNDFAQCFWLFNQTWNAVNDIAEAQGVYALCNTAENKWGLTNELSPEDCGFCMADAALNPSQFSNAHGDVWTIHREPYCAQLCIAQSNTSAIAEDCVSCVVGSEAGLPKAPSSCAFCMDDSFSDEQRGDCFACLAADGFNYGSGTSNYDWACGKCAAQTNPILRSLCFACIQSQNGFNDASAIDKYTEASICQCVDLTYNGFFINDPVTDVQQSCLANYTFGVPNTPGYINEAPNWGWPETVTTTTGSNADRYDCIQCVQDTPGADNKYACHEVCQDNKLIASVDAGNKCATCLANGNDGSSCKACLTASDDDSVNGKRDQCYLCLDNTGSGPSSDAASYVMACATCSGFANTAVWQDCYACLANDYPSALYPRAWDCINAVSNGTYTGGP